MYSSASAGNNKSGGVTVKTEQQQQSYDRTSTTSLCVCVCVFLRLPCLILRFRSSGSGQRQRLPLNVQEGSAVQRGKRIPKLALVFASRRSSSLSALQTLCTHRPSPGSRLCPFSSLPSLTCTCVLQEPPLPRLNN